MTLLLFIKGCCFFREWKDCQTAFLAVFVLFNIFVHKQLLARNALKKLKMHDQQTFCSFIFRSFSQSLLRPALIFSFASVGRSLSLILSHNLISTFNRPLHAPHCPSLKPWLFPSPDRRAYVLLNPQPKQESPDIVSSESLWNFSLKGYRSPDGVTLLYWFRRLKCCLIATRLAPLSC